MRRYLVFSLDFDTRAHLLTPEQDRWEAEVKRLHKHNREKLIEELRSELGESSFEEKLQNFKSIGALPFSIVSYHNQFHREIRSAFIHEFYYPALVGACALAERILNHLILDLRGSYTHTQEYKRVHRKDSFDNWDVPIRALSSWKVIPDEVANEFEALRQIRNRSLHFNTITYSSVRDDALKAINHLRQIIHLQFGFFSPKHQWAIRGTSGAQFVSKAYETNPFIKNFYIPQCPLVGPYYAVKFVAQGTLFLDRDDYDDRDISDSEFAALYEDRTLSQVVSSSVPLASQVRPVGLLSRDGRLYRDVRISDSM